LDARSPLVRMTVFEEFVHYYYQDYERRPMLLNWVLERHGGQAMSDLETATAVDLLANRDSTTRKYGPIITARLRWLEKYS